MRVRGLRETGRRSNRGCRWLTHRFRRGASEAGSVSLEYVIIFPAVLLLLFGIVQGAFFYYAKDVARHAAEAAAAAAAGYEANPAAGVAAANAFLAQTGGSLQGHDVSVTSDGTFVTATVSGSAPSIMDFIDLNVTQVARVPIEQWVVQP